VRTLRRFATRHSISAVIALIANSLLQQQVPNLIGYLRLFFLKVYLEQANGNIALLLTSLFLDFFDGMIARRLKQTSRFGCILDVFVDVVTRYALFSTPFNNDQRLKYLIGFSVIEVVVAGCTNFVNQVSERSERGMKQRRANAACIKINVTHTFCRRANRITHSLLLASLALFYRDIVGISVQKYWKSPEAWENFSNFSKYMMADNFRTKQGVVGIGIGLFGLPLMTHLYGLSRIEFMAITFACRLPVLAVEVEIIVRFLLLKEN